MSGASIIAMQNLRDGKPADIDAIPPWARIAPNDLVPSSTWRLSPAGLEVLALVEDLDREAAANIDRISREIVSDKWTATGEFQRRALEAEHDRDFTHRWYATRIETIMDWARANGHDRLFADILANDGNPPTFARLLATEKHRAERAEKERDDLQARLTQEQQDAITATGQIATAAQRMIDKANAEVSDLRLALAAERDEPDAGKDLGYDLVHGVYVRPVPGGHIEVERREEKQGRWRAYRFAKGLVVPPWRSVWGETARDVMREANRLEAERAPAVR